MINEDFGLIPLPDECPSTSTESPMSANSLQNDSKPSTPEPTVIKTSSKGVENAKKRLRAFSIQKKGIPAAHVVAASKSAGSGASTVVIGKLAKTPKPPPKPLFKPPPESEESKKIPKPPKPGHNLPYLVLQKQTLSDIENMKKKIEMVELGIPLGLICPSQTTSITKAMPTKAMPPIKTFLEPNQLDEIIKEAKKARAEGKEYKFDYQKLLPGYDNPFQRKKEEDDKEKDRKDKDRDRFDRSKPRYRDYSDHKRYDKKSRTHKRDRSKEREKEDREKETQDSKDDVILNEYVVCDSWSLENDDKSTSSADKEVKVEKDKKEVEKEVKPEPNPMDIVKENLTKQGLIKPSPEKETLIAPLIQKPKIEIIIEPSKKMEKLQPVVDSITYELDPKNEVLDIFDEDTETEKFSIKTEKHEDSISISSKNTSLDDDNDEFLESIINDINQEESQDRYEYKKKKNKLRDVSGSVTPELNDSMRASSSRSDSSEITSKSYESGYKSVESSFKSGDSSRSSSSLKAYDEKDINRSLIDKMSNATVESLETWSFVLKICQPLLFRHDKNKCYRETKSRPKLWYADNPKCCDCVKDRAIVYEELELCKVGIVEGIYGTESMDPPPPLSAREWYPVSELTLVESTVLHPSSEWEDSPSTPGRKEEDREEVTLDQEYQRFMDAVWPEIAENSRSPSTPVREESGKRKREKESEGWSQESDIETRITKKIKLEKDKKNRKRKRTQTQSETDRDDDKKKRKAIKAKTLKKHKALLVKAKRLEKKYLKCLKNKQKKKAKKLKAKLDKLEREADIEIEKSKKLAMKKKSKEKKRLSKKKKKDVSSSSSSDSSESEDGRSKKKDGDKSKKKKKRDKKRKKRKQSTSESTQSDELFDTDILNNIKKEKLSDTEKNEFSTQDFSPRRVQSKPSAEIINMKELQNDFESNNVMMVKKECEQKMVEEITSEENEEVEMENESVPESVKEIPDLAQKSEEIPTCAEKIPTVSSAPQSIPTLASGPAKTMPFMTKSQDLEPQVSNADEFYGNKDLNASEIEQHDQYSQDYEMYEQMAMEYQNNVAKKDHSSVYSEGSCRIETVVSGPRGEIKCDWRPNVQQPSTNVSRPSRWGLKPSDVNIVLTGHESHMNKETQVYQIKSILEQNTSNSSYDEAYADMYGALDRLQYGDCFGNGNGNHAEGGNHKRERASLDDRINKVLTEVSKDKSESEVAEKSKNRVKKSVSFADGFKPGQDSDSEKPPGRKRGGVIYGCAWPCPREHPAHVPLWDCLPPPPPPPGDPPLYAPPHPLQYMMHHFDPGVSLPGIMPEPPPSMMLQTAM